MACLPPDQPNHAHGGGPAANDRGLVSPILPTVAMTTTAADGSLAYLTVRPADPDADGCRRYEVGVIGHGASGQQLAKHVALHAARDQLILAAGVIADTMITLIGAIGTLVLANLIPDRRIRTSPALSNERSLSTTPKAPSTAPPTKPPSPSTSSPARLRDNHPRSLTTWPWR